MQRLGIVVGRTLLLLASLIAFPSCVPWMIAVWLLWHTISLWRGQTGWVPLLACAVILLVKRIDWPPAMWGLAAAAAVAAIVGVRRSSTAVGTSWTKGAWTAAGLLWIGWGLFVWESWAGTHCGRAVQRHGTRPVVCIGDSLTAGIPEGRGYPSMLRGMISLPVVDLSRHGITTEDALRELPKLIAAQPQVVVIELDGHDFLKGWSREKAKENLEQIIVASREIGAEVILMEIPRGLVMDDYAGLERELARRYDLELIADTPIRKLILMSPFAPPGMWLRKDQLLSDDGLHPNARGSALLAAEVLKPLVRWYGEEILTGR